MMSMEPFDIGRFLIAPGRKFHCILIKVKFKLGVLEKLASLASKFGVRVSYVSYSMQRDYGKSVKAVVFLDVTDITIPVERLIEEAKKLEFVEEIREFKPEIESLALDSFSFPLTIGDSRVIILREEGIRGIINGLRERLGSAAETIQYYVGFEAGLEFGRSHKKLGEALGIKSPSDIFSKISAPLFVSVGFGVMKVLKISENPPYAYLRVHRCFECECCPKRSDEPYSHLVRGMIAGAFTSVSGMEMFAKEIKCIAKGDPYCEFEITPKK